MTIKNLLNRIRLNLRAARLALAGRWLMPSDVAASYDALATTYQTNWLAHLCRTTDRLHELLPVNDSPAVHKPMRVIDLGCGTGYSTAFLAKQYPTASITAVDISGEMLQIAARSVSDGFETPVDHQSENSVITPEYRLHSGFYYGGHGVTTLPLIQFIQNDMQRFLESQPGQSCDLIFSAWAIGYSVPAKIIAESRRVLRPGGTLAVIVNRLGTMPAVFAAFRKTMRAFPASLEKALWPRFPRNAAEIESHLKRHPFQVQSLEEGVVPITPPEPGKRLEWLLGTGILAGFDAVLPLRESVEIRRFFERELDTATTGWEHHYVMFVAMPK